MKRYTFEKALFLIKEHNEYCMIRESDPTRCIYCDGVRVYMSISLDIDNRFDILYDKPYLATSAEMMARDWTIVELLEVKKPNQQKPLFLKEEKKKAIPTHKDNDKIDTPKEKDKKVAENDNSETMDSLTKFVEGFLKEICTEVQKEEQKEDVSKYKSLSASDDDVNVSLIINGKEIDDKDIKQMLKMKLFGDYHTAVDDLKRMYSPYDIFNYHKGFIFV